MLLQSKCNYMWERLNSGISFIWVWFVTLTNMQIHCWEHMKVNPDSFTTLSTLVDTPHHLCRNHYVITRVPSHPLWFSFFPSVLLQTHPRDSGWITGWCCSNAGPNPEASTSWDPQHSPCAPDPHRAGTGPPGQEPGAVILVTWDRTVSGLRSSTTSSKKILGHSN